MDSFTHYTRTAQAVGAILKNGFAWAPHGRNLIHALVPEHDFTNCEPQQFGMVSFTEQNAPASAKHRQEFGDYGIVVSGSWLRTNGGRRVTYIDKQGPDFPVLRAKFSDAYKELTAKIKYPDDGFWRMAYVYKPMAKFVGARLWADALETYEYLEPIVHSYQKEWRICHPEGVGNLASDPRQRIENVSPPQGWGKHYHVLTVPSKHVTGFVCPRLGFEKLRAELSEAFADKTISLYDG